MTFNDVEIDGATFNGVELDAITFNGVEVWSGSKPWVAYDYNGGKTMVINSPAVAPHYIGNIQVPSDQYSWQVDQYGNNNVYIESCDLPTQGCKFMDVIVRNIYDVGGTALVYGKKKGESAFSLIKTLTVPKYSQNNLNYLHGKELIKYCVNLTDIDVKGYEYVKVRQNGIQAPTNTWYAGLGVLSFHN